MRVEEWPDETIVDWAACDFWRYQRPLRNLKLQAGRTANQLRGHLFFIRGPALPSVGNSRLGQCRLPTDSKAEPRMNSSQTICEQTHLTVRHPKTCDSIHLIHLWLRYHTRHFFV